MKGTEKQVKWAEDIKQSAYNTLKWIETMHETDRFYTASDLQYVSAEAVNALRSEFDAVFSRIDSASVIIDKRNYFTRQQIIKHGRDWMRTHGQADLAIG